MSDVNRPTKKPRGRPPKDPHPIDGPHLPVLRIDRSPLDQRTRLIHLIHRPCPQVLRYIDDGMTASSLQEPFKEEDLLLKRTGRTEQPGGMKNLMYHHIDDLTLRPNPP